MERVYSRTGNDASLLRKPSLSNRYQDRILNSKIYATLDILLS